MDDAAPYDEPGAVGFLVQANPADEPSRVDLSGVRWRVLACPGLVSEPVPVSWPQEDNWRDPAGWARLAAGRAAAAAGW